MKPFTATAYMQNDFIMAVKLELNWIGVFGLHFANDTIIKIVHFIYEKLF